MSDSDERKGGQLKVTERAQTGGPGPHNQMVGQKANTFGPSAKRLIARMRPERSKALAVVGLTVLSVGLSAVGPRVLGHATDLIFGGFVSAKLPAGITKAEAIAGLRAKGQDKVADMLSSMDIVPGQGVDFDAVAQILLVVLAIYLFSSLLSWLAGYLLNDVVQAMIRRMRGDIEDKVHRLPLDYFDRQPRGELLSRVTNDIDNISQSLQQTMSQLLTSVLTIISVLAMMIWISPLLALVAVLSVPVSMFVAALVMKRSQGRFIQQWRSTGRLNSHVEEAF